MGNVRSNRKASAATTTRWWHSGLLLIWLWAAAAASVIAATDSHSEEELTTLLNITLPDGITHSRRGRHHVFLNASSLDRVPLQCNSQSDLFVVASRRWSIDRQPIRESQPVFDPGKHFQDGGGGGGGTALVECLASSTTGRTAYGFSYIHADGGGVDVDDEPVVSIAVTPKDPVEGAEVSIACESDRKDVDLVLRRNAAALEGAFSSSSSTTTYRIPDVSRNHSGVYGCRASSEDGDPVAHSDLLLEVRYKPVLTIVPESTVSVNATDDLVLRCGSEGYPLPSIAWLGDGGGVLCGELENCESSSDTTTPSSSFSELVLGNVTAGRNYSCEASNEVGSAGASTVVEVKFELPEIEWIHEQQLTLFGGDVTIGCEASGWPPPSVRWLRNGEVVSESASLEVKSFSPAHEGAYTCVAENLYGSDAVRTELRGARPIAPSAQEGEKLVLSAGTSASLNCSAEVDDALEVERRWFKDGEEIAAQRGRDSIAIPYLTVRDHEGSYKCSIRSGLETVDVVWELEVSHAPPKLKRPEATRFRILRGDGLTVPCEVVEGTPEPEIHWSLNNEKKLSESSSNLVVVDAGADDQGQYSCMAVNEYGSDTITFEMGVFNRTAVRLLPGPDFEADTLAGIVMECLATTDSRIDLSEVEYGWRKDGQGIFSGGSSRQLTIGNVTSADSGTYSCEASTALDTAAASTRLLVKGASPTIVSTDKEVRVLEGSGAKLRCQADGLPAPKVRWSRAGEKFAGKKRFALSPLGHLKISVVKVEDEGVFRCSATNLYGSIETEVSVQVIRKLSGPAAWKEVAADFGANVTLECKVSVDPRIRAETKTKWFKWIDEKPQLLTYGDRILAENGSLHIANLTGTDMGLYRCSVKSPLDETSHNVSLTVIGKAPTVLSPLKTITLLENASAELECVYAGVPEPRVNWYLDDRALALAPPSRGFVSTLSANASGSYTCEATNQYGSSLAKVANVRVLKPTTVEISNETVVIDAGKRLKIPCRFSFDPPNRVTGIRWEKDGRPIDVTFEDRVDFGMDGSVAVGDVQIRHGGTYRCIVTTEHDEANATVNVDVVVSAPVIVNHSKDQDVFGGDSVALLCNAKGIPAPVIAWSFNDTETAVEGEEYRVTNAMATDAGSYTCAARNRYGGTKRDIKLDVVTLFNLPGEHVLDEGQDLKLPCVDVSRHAGVTAVWKRKEEVVGSGDVLPDGSLFLRAVTRGMTGEYSCSVQSSSSLKRKVLKTFVSLRRKLIVSAGGNLRASAGETIVMECSVLPSVAASKRLWTFNGDFFLPGSRKTVGANGEFLRIVDLVESDGGNYSCVSGGAEGSKDGRDAITFMLSVDENLLFSRREGCEAPRAATTAAVSRIALVDNETASVEWLLPDGFETSCYEAFNLVWWSNETAHYFEELLSLDRREASMRHLDASAGYYVQVNLVGLETGVVVEGRTMSFAVPGLLSKKEEEELLSAGTRIRRSGFFHRYGIVAIVAASAVLLAALVSAVLLMYRKGRCARCRNDGNSMCGKTDFNGFDSNAYHSSIIPLDVAGSRSLNNGSEYMLKVSGAPQWPEPDNSNDLSHDEHDPFLLQRCSSFSPNSSSSPGTSELNTAQQQQQLWTRRHSKANSISSSWSSVFNVPVATEFLDLPTSAPSNGQQHGHSQLPTESTFTPKRTQPLPPRE